MTLQSIKRALGAAAAMLAIHAAAPAAAPADDASWVRAQALLLKNKGLVAHQVVTQVGTADQPAGRQRWQL